MTGMEPWAPGRVSELADIWNESEPDEPLVEDELEACWHDAAVVIGTDDGAVVAHHVGGVTWLDLLAVRPRARRRGIGTRLVTAAIESFDTARVQWGASAPWYLWPGIDAARTEALALAESMGFANQSPAIQNLTVDPQWQVGRAASTDLIVRRVGPETAAEVLDLLGAEYAGWLDEVTRGIEHATVHAVFDEHGPIGVGAHSINRLGWIGPMATFGRGRGRGVGTEVLAAVCADLASAGYRRCEIAWVGPIRFYVKVSGATAGRTFLPLSKVVR